VSTATDIIGLIETVTTDVLDAMGQTELAALLQAAEKLVLDVTVSMQQKTINLPVQVAAADIAADVAEDQKFPKP